MSSLNYQNLTPQSKTYFEPILVGSEGLCNRTDEKVTVLSSVAQIVRYCYQDKAILEETTEYHFRRLIRHV